MAINTDPGTWRGAWVNTQWPDKTLSCDAWWGHDLNKPLDKHSDGGGWINIYAAPKGYAVYVVE